MAQTHNMEGYFG